MDTEAGGDRAAQDSVQSVSGVTEAGTSGNAVPGDKQARQRGGLDAGLLTVVEKAAVDDGDGVGWEVGEVTTATGDEDDEAAASSPVRRTAARLGWLLLGFLAGAAAAVLVLMRHESPVTCTVVPT